MSIRRQFPANLFVRIVSLAAILAIAKAAAARATVDFDPNLDFSKYKTFAYVGGVENLVMLQVNPDLINTQLHRLVVAELTKKGLKEVTSGQQPDLVVRYWAGAESQVNLDVMGNWGAYGPYVSGPWAPMYEGVTSAHKKEGTLILDLIDTKAKALAWRAYATGKLSDPDKAWRRVEDQFLEAFKSYPPSGAELEEKRKEKKR